MNTVGTHSSSCCRLSVLRPRADNLQVQWGSQDHYEIVRKVGRGKYSEVRLVHGFVVRLMSHVESVGF